MYDPSIQNFVFKSRNDFVEPKWIFSSFSNFIILPMLNQISTGRKCPSKQFNSLLCWIKESMMGKKILYSGNAWEEFTSAVHQAGSDFVVIKNNIQVSSGRLPCILVPYQSMLGIISWHMIHILNLYILYKIYLYVAKGSVILLDYFYRVF